MSWIVFYPNVLHRRIVRAMWAVAIVVAGLVAWATRYWWIP